MTTRSRKPKSRAVGRPVGTDNTQDQILAMAREMFGTHGFDGTSLRAVAVKAGVDPSTVIHFFKTKDGLFEAVIRDVAPATLGFREALKHRATGTELVKLYLLMWEADQAGGAMRAVIRTSFSSQKAVALLRGSLTAMVLESASHADPLAAELAFTHLVGIGIGRYIAMLPQLVDADIDAIASRVGPTIDHYLYAHSS